MNIWIPMIEPSTSTATMVVDNRVFLLGLNEMYRNAVKRLESRLLLSCARKVARVLGVQPADVFVEGHFRENGELQEYFRLLKSLQALPDNRTREVAGLHEFQLLEQYLASSLFGQPQPNGKLLPTGRDPLSLAAETLAPVWKFGHLVRKAADIALHTGDISPVGLAARARDAVAITACSESTVPHPEPVWHTGMEEPDLHYEWQVDKDVTEAANRFVDTVNRFVKDALPCAEACNAEWFFKGFAENDVIGRCVRIGEANGYPLHYHWAVTVQFLPRRPGEIVQLAVDEFWSEHMWTSEMYRHVQGHPRRMKAFRSSAAPSQAQIFRMPKAAV